MRRFTQTSLPPLLRLTSSLRMSRLSPAASRSHSPPSSSSISTTPPPPPFKRRRLSTTTTTTPSTKTYTPPTLTYRSITPPPKMTSTPPSPLPALELTKRESLIRQILVDLSAHLEVQGVVSPSIPESAKSDPLTLRFTGGWVRDKLLRGKSNDIDVAINKMTGYDFAVELKKWMGREHERYREAIREIDIEDGEGEGEVKGEKGEVEEKEEKVVKQLSGSVHKIESNPDKSKHLETATTRLLGLDIDLVNLRSETYSENSRIPTMEFGTPEEDALRRDATVNALFYNIHTQEVEDFTKKGLEDMALKLIRTPLAPFETFNDDPLRVLRLIRFASRLDFQIVDEVKAAMKDPVIQEALKMKISRERVGIEFDKMVKGVNPRLSFSLIHHLGLYTSIFAPPSLEIPSSLNPDEMYTAANILDTLLLSSDPLTKRLLPTKDSLYLAWNIIATLPWASHTLPYILPPKGKPTRNLDSYTERTRIQQALQTKSVPMWPAPAIAAKDALKLSNKVIDILKLSFENAPKFSALASSSTRPPREDLGMDLRAAGDSWRIQTFAALLLELVPPCLATSGRDLSPLGPTFQRYVDLLDYIDELDLNDAYLAKPCINGTDLAKAVAPERRAGPWLRNATEGLVKWQFKNPGLGVEEALRWIGEGGLAYVLEGEEEQVMGKKKKEKRRKEGKGEGGKKE